MESNSNYPTFAASPRLIRWFLALMTSLVLAASVAAQKPKTAALDDNSAGFIVSVRGTWISSKTGQPLGASESVFTGNQITAKMPASQDSFISIALYDGQTTKNLKCRSASDCDPPYTVPSVRNPDGFLTRVFNAIWHLDPSELTKVVLAQSRGPGGPEEAVLALGQNGIPDLGPALKPVAAGSYTAELFFWPDTDGAPAMAASGSLEWSGSRADWKPSGPVKPGLYQLAFANSRGQPQWLNVTVLVASAPNYGNFQRAFARWETTTNRWKSEENAEAVHSFRVGFLIALWRDPSLAE
jgi:hypothetical protein